MEIFKQELKRKMPFKRVFVYLSLSLLMGVLWGWFIVGGAREGFMMSGCYRGYKGVDAIKKAAEDRAPTEGIMTIERFKKAGDVFLDSGVDPDDSNITVGEEVLEYAVYADILVMQDWRINSMYGDYSGMFERGYGEAFYLNEDYYYGEYIENTSENPQQKEMAQGLWEDVEKPYTYYSGFKQWDEGREHIMLLTFVLMIISVCFASGIISDDKECGAHELMRTTLRGRELALSKVAVPIIMSVAIYMVGMGVYMLIMYSFIPEEALKTSIQIAKNSILPYTLGGVIGRTLVVGLLAVLMASSFTLMVSGIFKKTWRVKQISILMVVCGFVYNMFLGGKSFVSEAIGSLIPGGIVFLYPKFITTTSFPIREVFGVNIWVTWFMAIVSMVFIIMVNLYTFRRYRRR